MHFYSRSKFIIHIEKTSVSVSGISFYSVYSSLKGYNPKNSLDIVFHVIIAKPFWEWDKSSHVFLRFGSKDLGGWKQNIGTFVKRLVSELACIKLVIMLIYIGT